MIRTEAYIHTDHTGKELLDSRMELFDFNANKSDVNRYGNGRIPVHWHRELELFLLDRGSVWITAGKQKYYVTEGEGCFINSGVLHAFTADTREKCSYRSFVFSADIISGSPGSIFDVKYIHPLTEGNVPVHWYDRRKKDVFLYETFQKAFAICEEEAYGYEFRLRNLLSEMLLYICEAHPENESTKISIQEQRLKKMISWIQEHIADTITVSDVASSVNISPRECQRTFQKHLHCTPSEYMTHTRMYKAAGQLAQSDKAITEIALDCGYQSMSYFSRQFKAFAECTPGTYRKQYRAKDTKMNQGSDVHRVVDF